ncbi:uncharacterized protein MONBRDRAFT_38117 [Monosiga brevicollis MX1]|uniref:USP domain-containing protein n=1 Tax=Monosiga brevicollis TaxID=81824 RepID=A9V5S8_MONBE|nr:uncharacterized protein MONBRDRAFT_38117 [Monosiga brevicollis MX1]EDQ87095.1 predicted protein [Monosiga brevicollis MX1]|eukprot:XP_001748038.1 hypothetical protein [Monosiga brevicollis MX1]
MSDTQIGDDIDVDDGDLESLDVPSEDHNLNVNSGFSEDHTMNTDADEDPFHRNVDAMEDMRLSLRLECNPMLAHYQRMLSSLSKCSSQEGPDSPLPVSNQRDEKLVTIRSAIEEGAPYLSLDHRLLEPDYETNNVQLDLNWTALKTLQRPEDGPYRVPEVLMTTIESQLQGRWSILVLQNEPLGVAMQAAILALNETDALHADAQLNRFLAVLLPDAFDKLLTSSALYNWDLSTFQRIQRLINILLRLCIKLIPYDNVIVGDMLAKVKRLTENLLHHPCSAAEIVILTGLTRPFACIDAVEGNIISCFEAIFASTVNLVEHSDPLREAAAESNACAKLLEMLYDLAQDARKNQICTKMASFNASAFVIGSIITTFLSVLYKTACTKLNMSSDELLQRFFEKFRDLWVRVNAENNSKLLKLCFERALVRSDDVINVIVANLKAYWAHCREVLQDQPENEDPDTILLDVLFDGVAYAEVVSKYLDAIACILKVNYDEHRLSSARLNLVHVQQSHLIGLDKLWELVAACCCFGHRVRYALRFETHELVNRMYPPPTLCAACVYSLEHHQLGYFFDVLARFMGALNALGLPMQAVPVPPQLSYVVLRDTVHEEQVGSDAVNQSANSVLDPQKQESENVESWTTGSKHADARQVDKNGDIHRNNRGASPSDTGENGDDTNSARTGRRGALFETDENDPGLQGNDDDPAAFAVGRQSLAAAGTVVGTSMAGPSNHLQPSFEPQHEPITEDNFDSNKASRRNSLQSTGDMNDFEDMTYDSQSLPADPSRASPMSEWSKEAPPLIQTSESKSHPELQGQAQSEADGLDRVDEAQDAFPQKMPQNHESDSATTSRTTSIEQCVEPHHFEASDFMTSLLRVTRSLAILADIIKSHNDMNEVLRSELPHACAHRGRDVLLTVQQRDGRCRFLVRAHTHEPAMFIRNQIANFLQQQVQSVHLSINDQYLRSSDLSKSLRELSVTSDAIVTVSEENGLYEQHFRPSEQCSSLALVYRLRALKQLLQPAYVCNRDEAMTQMRLRCAFLKSHAAQTLFALLQQPFDNVSDAREASSFLEIKVICLDTILDVMRQALAPSTEIVVPVMSAVRSQTGDFRGTALIEDVAAGAAGDGVVVSFQYPMQDGLQLVPEEAHSSGARAMPMEPDLTRQLFQNRSFNDEFFQCCKRLVCQACRQEFSQSGEDGSAIRGPMRQDSQLLATVTRPSSPAVRLIHQLALDLMQLSVQAGLTRPSTLGLDGSDRDFLLLGLVHASPAIFRSRFGRFLRHAMGLNLEEGTARSDPHPLAVAPLEEAEVASIAQRVFEVLYDAVPACWEPAPSDSGRYEELLGLLVDLLARTQVEATKAHGEPMPLDPQHIFEREAEWLQRFVACRDARAGAAHEHGDDPGATAQGAVAMSEDEQQPFDRHETNPSPGRLQAPTPKASTARFLEGHVKLFKEAFGRTHAEYCAAFVQDHNFHMFLLTTALLGAGSALQAPQEAPTSAAPLFVDASIRDTLFSLLASIVQVSVPALNEVCTWCKTHMLDPVIPHGVGWTVQIERRQHAVGLRNGGATCYMNSLFQQLFMQPSLRRALIDIPTQTRGFFAQQALAQSNSDTAQLRLSMDDRLVDKYVHGAQTENTLLQLQRIFAHLNSDAKSVSLGPDLLTSPRLERIRVHAVRILGSCHCDFSAQSKSVVCCWLCLGLQFYSPELFWATFKLWGEPINVRVQSDAVEFLQTLVDQTDELLQSAGAAPILAPLLKFEMITQIIGKSCRHTSERHEDTFNLSLPVMSHDTMHEALLDSVQGEMFTGANQYRCQECGVKVDAMKRSCIKTLPPMLMVQLKRFGYDLQTFQPVKHNVRFEFPQELDLEPYTYGYLTQKERQEAQEAASDADNAADAVDLGPANSEGVSPAEIPPCCKYRLQGVVVHMGSASAGHYYSFSRTRETPTTLADGSAGKWLKFNDEQVTEVIVNRDLCEDQFYGGGTTYNTEYGTFEKNYSAYILVYERLDVLEELRQGQSLNPSPQPPPVQTPAEVAMLDGFEVPPQLSAEIQAGNLRFEFLHQLLSPSFAGFLTTLVQQGLYTPPVVLATQALLRVGLRVATAVWASSEELIKSVTMSLANPIFAVAVREVLAADGALVTDLLQALRNGVMRSRLLELVETAMTSLPAESEISAGLRMPYGPVIQALLAADLPVDHDGCAPLLSTLFCILRQVPAGLRPDCCLDAIAGYASRLLLSEDGSLNGPGTLIPEVSAKLRELVSILCQYSNLCAHHDDDTVPVRGSTNPDIDNFMPGKPRDRVEQPALLVGEPPLAPLSDNLARVIFHADFVRFMFDSEQLEDPVLEQALLHLAFGNRRLSLIILHEYMTAFARRQLPFQGLMAWLSAFWALRDGLDEWRQKLILHGGEVQDAGGYVGSVKKTRGLVKLVEGNEQVAVRYRYLKVLLALGEQHPGLMTLVPGSVCLALQVAADEMNTIATPAYSVSDNNETWNQNRLVRSDSFRTTMTLVRNVLKPTETEAQGSLEIPSATNGEAQSNGSALNDENELVGDVWTSMPMDRMSPHSETDMIENESEA